MIKNRGYMEGTIFIVGKDQKLVELREEKYDSEAILQDLLAQYPKLLAGDQINSDEPRRWLLVSKELPIPDDHDTSGRYSLDHFFLDQDAVPTLVEVKRSTDTRIRREVVAQMLDYAANSVVYLSVERIRNLFNNFWQQSDQSPDSVLDEFLEGADPDDFWQQVKTNLQAGKIRLLFVADKIPTELRRIVEFLNVQMDPAEVLAVEVRQYSGGEIKSLVPRVIGQTAEAQSKKAGAPRVTRQWDEESFFKDLQDRHGEQIAGVARKIMDWSDESLTRIVWGKGKHDGSLTPVLDHKGVSYWPFAVWTYGTIDIQFQWLKDKPPFDSDEKRFELLRKLNEIEGVELPEDSITRRPGFKISALTKRKSLDEFFSTMAWVLQVINETGLRS